MLTLQIIIDSFISKEIAINKNNSKVIGIDFSLDERQQVTATEDGIVIIKNQLNEEVKRINLQQKSLTNIAFLDANLLIIRLFWV